MYTKLAFVQGVQSSLVEAGYLSYSGAEEAGVHAQKLASCLTADPAEFDLSAHQVAEIADTLIGMKTASAPQEDEVSTRLTTAAGNIKRAMREGGDLAGDGESGGSEDTNADAGYDVAGNGDTATPIGAGSTTGDERATPQPDSVADRMAPEGVNGAGADTNAKAKYDVAGNGDSSVAERQTTGDELKVARAWGRYLDPSIDAGVKVATIRELAVLPTDEERVAIVDYVNANYARKQAAASDDDILAAMAGSAASSS